jgi:hypothetical protein
VVLMLCGTAQARHLDRAMFLTAAMTSLRRGICSRATSAEMAQSGPFRKDGLTTLEKSPGRKDSISTISYAAVALRLFDHSSIDLLLGGGINELGRYPASGDLKTESKTESQSTVLVSPGLISCCSALECAKCREAGTSATDCATCGCKIAPEHLVVKFVRHVYREEYPIVRPFYPSGNPATGPTYMEPAVGVTTHTQYEVIDGRGSKRSVTDERQEGQCDHCHELDEIRHAVRRSIESREATRLRLANSVPKIRWQDVWWSAFVWGLVSVLPLGLALSGIRSFALLLVGMAIAAGVGGVRSHDRQMRPIKEAELRKQDWERKEQAELDSLFDRQATLEAICRANASRVNA